MLRCGSAFLPLRESNEGHRHSAGERRHGHGNAEEPLHEGALHTDERQCGVATLAKPRMATEGEVMIRGDDIHLVAVAALERGHGRRLNASLNPSSWGRRTRVRDPQASLELRVLLFRCGETHPRVLRRPAAPSTARVIRATSGSAAEVKPADTARSTGPTSSPSTPSTSAISSAWATAPGSSIWQTRTLSPAPAARCAAIPRLPYPAPGVDGEKPRPPGP